MDLRVEKSQVLMFKLAALFNILIAIMLALWQRQILPFLGMEPLANAVFLHLALGLVFIYGVGYYRVSMNLEKNRDIAWLGFWGKLLVVVLLLGHAVKGNVSWGLASLGSGDLLFALLFLRFLRLSRPVSL